jgi:hypothetical protein
VSINIAEWANRVNGREFQHNNITHYVETSDVVIDLCLFTVDQDGKNGLRTIVRIVRRVLVPHSPRITARIGITRNKGRRWMLFF